MTRASNTGVFDRVWRIFDGAKVKVVFAFLLDAGGEEKWPMAWILICMRTI